MLLNDSMSGASGGVAALILGLKSIPGSKCNCLRGPLQVQQIEYDSHKRWLAASAARSVQLIPAIHMT